VDFHGFPKISMELYGFRWVSTYFYRFLWISTDLFCGFLAWRIFIVDFWILYCKIGGSYGPANEFNDFGEKSGNSGFSPEINIGGPFARHGYRIRWQGREIRSLDQNRMRLPANMVAQL
jgi:hypothetical protein